MEYLQQAMSIDKKGIYEQASRLLVWKETCVSITQWERVLAFDYLVSSRVSCER
jgi:hypothetical protein